MMTINTVTQTQISGTYASQARSETEKETPYGRTGIAHRVITDIVDISLPQEKVHMPDHLNIGASFQAEYEAFVQYGKESSAYYYAQRDAHNALLEKLIRESGGLLYGTAISNDLSTITTTSGATHPRAAEIRSFVNEHLDEWNTLKSSRNFPSFEDWKKANGY